MMMRFFFITIFSVCALTVTAQDTLPKFSVSNLGYDASGNARVIISWVNNFEGLKQISIQTSHDSLKNYRTLTSLTDPTARTNGYADKKALNDHMFYRLFIVKADGDYFFTDPKRPTVDTTTNVVVAENRVVKKIEEVKKPDFTPSFYVYTNKDGYVYINLPDAEQQNYSIKFYEENNDFLFEVKNLKQTGITLDKTNFLQAGWYQFELFNNGSLVEKHKFYLAKEF